MSLEWQTDGLTDKRDAVTASVTAALYLSLKWRDKSNLTSVGRMPTTKGGDSEFRRQGRSEVPISPTVFPSLPLSKCTMHNALLGVGKRKRALGIHGMRCSYNNFDKMRMEEEGTFTPDNRVCSEGRKHRGRLYSWTYPSPLLLHLAPGEPRPLSFFVGKIRQCSAFSPVALIVIPAA